MASPFFSAFDTIQTPYGMWVKPGGNVVAYVRSTGVQSGDLPEVAVNMVASVAAACSRCRAGMNDVIVVLPGHVESLAVADSLPNLVAGTQIVGVGRPGASNNPTLTWTATASTLLLNVADVSLIGLNLVWNGIDGVVSAIPVTAAGCTIAKCHITVESASAGALLGVTVGNGASNFAFCENTVVGVGEAQPLTSAVVLVNAAVDDVCIEDNYIAAANPGTSVLGLIAVTAAATNLRIRRNELVQLETAGTALFGITVGDVAASGVISRNFCKIGSTVTATTSGFTIGTAALVAVGLFENYCTDTAAVSGVLSPVAAA
jgi:hypothetical protein